MTLNTVLGPSSSNSMYYHSDGNGNVTTLVNPSQYIVAKYLYDAFGNMLSAAGSLAQQNLYRFSSKEAHLNSGLVYYVYRYYDPNLQRWPNRDPLTSGPRNNFSIRGLVIEEYPFVFVHNNALSGYDAFGLCSRSCCMNSCWVGESICQTAAGTGPLAPLCLELCVPACVGSCEAVVAASCGYAGAACITACQFCSSP